MRDAAKRLEGMQDFRSFAEDDPRKTSTRVLVDRVELLEEGDLILVRLRASHFLWKMVRRVVGVLAEVGRGALSREDVERFLREASDEPAPLTAPPSGLFLERVFYEGDKQDWAGHGMMMGKEQDMKYTVTKKSDKEITIAGGMGPDTFEQTCKK